jgi:DNA-directed RNA polymerase specialized sigma24 family protein
MKEALPTQPGSPTPVDAAEITAHTAGITQRDACHDDAHEGAADLLAGMLAGDRDAAARFVTRFGPRVRRRVRGKLSPAMRRLFDSQEILSTVARRLDQFVQSGQLTASNEGELWSLVFAMAEHAVIDKARVFRKLQRVEDEDSVWASRLAERLQAASGASDGVELTLCRVFESLPDPVDREILSLWLADTPHTVTSRMVNMTPNNVRQRWSKIKDSLRETLTLEGAA